MTAVLRRFRAEMTSASQFGAVLTEKSLAYLRMEPNPGKSIRYTVRWPLSAWTFRSHHALEPARPCTSTRGGPLPNVVTRVGALPTCTTVVALAFWRCLSALDRTRVRLTNW